MMLVPLIRLPCLVPHRHQTRVHITSTHQTAEYSGVYFYPSTCLPTHSLCSCTCSQQQLALATTCAVHMWTDRPCDRHPRPQHDGCDHRCSGLVNSRVLPACSYGCQPSSNRDVVLTHADVRATSDNSCRGVEVWGPCWGSCWGLHGQEDAPPFRPTVSPCPTATGDRCL